MGTVRNVLHASNVVLVRLVSERTRAGGLDAVSANDRQPSVMGF